MLEIKGKVNTALCFAKVIEDVAVEQIRRMCDYPFTEGSRIRIMPDVHAGKGCTIGTTMTITDKAVTNVVGVDIGCGMYTVKLGNLNKKTALATELRWSLRLTGQVTALSRRKCWGRIPQGSPRITGNAQPVSRASRNRLRGNPGDACVEKMKYTSGLSPGAATTRGSSTCAGTVCASIETVRHGRLKPWC